MRLSARCWTQPFRCGTPRGTGGSSKGSPPSSNAAPGAGKSMLTQTLAIAVAGGGEFMAGSVRPLDACCSLMAR